MFPVSGADISSKSAPTLFAAGTTYLFKNGIAVLPIVCANATNPLPLENHENTVNHYQQPFSATSNLKMIGRSFSKHLYCSCYTNRVESNFFTIRVPELEFYAVE